MAESNTEAETPDVLNVTLNETAGNVTAKIPATPEGMAIAYGSLVIMALLPIFFGAFRSVKYHKEQRVRKCKSALVTNCACVCKHNKHAICSHTNCMDGFHGMYFKILFYFEVVVIIYGNRFSV